ncbi:hypothetical protein SAMN05216388_10761, partial [Halorientalis persicus]
MSSENKNHEHSCPYCDQRQFVQPTTCLQPGRVVPWNDDKPFFEGGTGFTLHEALTIDGRDDDDSIVKCCNCETFFRLSEDGLIEIPIDGLRSVPEDALLTVVDPRDLDQGVQEQPVTRMPAPEGDRPGTSDGHEMKRYKKDDLRKSSDARQGSLGEVADIVGERDKVSTKNVTREMAESREVNEADALIDHREHHDERCATQMGEEARLNLSRRPGETLEQYETRLAEQRVHQDDHETA